MERNLNVTEYPTFEAAWEAANLTRERFAGYQGMVAKIDHISKASRWFVTEAGELWYSYVLPKEGLRIVAEASPISILSSGNFQYIQIMVSPYRKSDWKETHDQKGHLRFSGAYYSREIASKLSKDAEVFAFNK